MIELRKTTQRMFQGVFIKNYDEAIEVKQSYCQDARMDGLPVHYALYLFNLDYNLTKIQLYARKNMGVAVTKEYNV